MNSSTVSRRIFAITAFLLLTTMAVGAVAIISLIQIRGKTMMMERNVIPGLIVDEGIKEMAAQASALNDEVSHLLTLVEGRQDNSRDAADEAAIENENSASAERDAASRSTADLEN